MRERLLAAYRGWQGRPVTSNRMFGTAVGLLALGVPINLWYVVVGPTARDRLVAFGLLLAAVLLAVYSLWEAKAETSRGRSDPDERGT